MLSFTVSFAALRFVCCFAISFSVNPNSPTALALGFQSLKEKAGCCHFGWKSPTMVYGTIPVISTSYSYDYFDVYSYSFRFSFTCSFTAYFTVSFAALRVVCFFARSFSS